MFTKRVIIAGSRNFIPFNRDLKKIDNLLQNIEEPIIISGCADGADKFGEMYAEYNCLQVERYPADWTKYGKRAGYIRNKQMGEVADMAIIFWDGKSKGSKMMIDIMKELNKPYRIIMFEPSEFSKSLVKNNT